MKEETLLNKAIRVLSSGGVIIYPTETVYGLGVDATNKMAVKKIFEIKRRDKFKPILIAFSSVEMAKKYVWWNKYADKLANKFLPGPLSLVLSIKDENIVEDIYQGGIKVGIRIPKNDFTLKLISTFNRPITSTSANISGENPPTKVEEIDKEVKDKVDLVVEMGACEIGKPSTIVDVSSYPPRLIREGVIKFKDVLDVINS